MQIKILFRLLIAEFYLTDFDLMALLDSFQSRFATLFNYIIVGKSSAIKFIRLRSITFYKKIVLNGFKTGRNPLLDKY